MQQVSIRINQLPLNLVCLENGTVALQPNQKFTTLIDTHGGIFDESGFSVNGESYQYNQALEYKNDTNLLGWLVAQEIPLPVLQQSQPFGGMPDVAEMMRRAQEGFNQQGGT